jgi:hypothetical protein
MLRCLGLFLLFFCILTNQASAHPHRLTCAKMYNKTDCRIAQELPIETAMTVDEALEKLFNLENTKHGEDSLEEREFSQIKLEHIIRNGINFLQRDGATVFLRKSKRGIYDFVVMGEKGIITALNNLDIQAIRNLARNHGWEIHIP